MPAFLRVVEQIVRDQVRNEMENRIQPNPPVVRDVRDDNMRYRDHRIELIDGCRKSFMKHLREIPIFNGESYQKLNEFIEIADVLYGESQNEAEDREFYTNVALKLRSEARAIYHQQMDNWINMKIALRA